MSIVAVEALPAGPVPPFATAVDGFRAAMVGAGLEPPETIIADGALHRFSSNGKRGDDSGWYTLHLDGIAAGAFGCWRSGIRQTWHARTERKLTQEELKAHRERVESMRAERKAEEAKRHGEAAETARRLWNSAAPAPATHPYLQRKHIRPHGARVDGEDLLVPMTIAGEIVNLQRITPAGEKRFLSGGRTSGCLLVLGKPDGVLYLAEGFATTASIREATGAAVVIAFSASNLRPVAMALREKFPELRIVVAGDNDNSGTGQRAAREAAEAVDGTVALPATEGMDFNDVAVAEGLAAVRAGVEAAAEANSEPHAEAGEHAQAAQETEAVAAEYVGHSFGGGAFELRKHGVYFAETNKDGEPVETWICSPLRVVAKTRDGASADWGRLLEWHDDDNVQHTWSMPASLLQGDGLDVRRELAHGGLHIAPGVKARNLLTAYLQTAPVEVRARSVRKLGWHDGVYVTATGVYGASVDERPVFQNEATLLPESSATGTADEWRTEVASLAQGNSRLTFSICVAFAAPLLELTGEDSGGFHLRGSSSAGKTTALRLAASVYGSPTKYVRTWRATSNGLEGIAAVHNDGLLVLDELHQIDPQQAGETAYMLANGQGKARASRTGTARTAQSWRLLFLSSGEQSLSARLASIGKSSTAGQEVRLADIPADAERGMGIVEELHGMASSAELIARLTEGFSQFHGAVGRSWLELLARDRSELLGSLRENLDAVTAELLGADASGQVRRVARRFALAALAGDLAGGYGLTGWPAGEALAAARICFTAWLTAFGGHGNHEERALLAQVEAFLEAHGGSRFEPVDGVDRGPPVRDRVGFVRIDGDGTRQYLVLPEQFRREVVTGFDVRYAARVLAENDVLVRQADRFTCMERIPALNGSRRVYVLTGKAVGEPL
jgi:putative DNA primase/helicase